MVAVTKAVRELARANVLLAEGTQSVLSILDTCETDASATRATLRSAAEKPATAPAPQMALPLRSRPGTMW